MAHIFEKVQYTEEINAIHSHPADGGILGDVKQDLRHLRCHAGCMAETVLRSGVLVFPRAVAEVHKRV